MSGWLLFAILPKLALSISFSSEGSSFDYSKGLGQGALSAEGGGTDSFEAILGRKFGDELLRGLNVGTEPRGADVVADGVAQWTRQHAAKIPYSDDEVTLYVTMDSEERGAQKFLPPHVRTSAVAWGLSDAPPPRHPPKRSGAIGAGSVAKVKFSSDLGLGEADLSFESPKVVQLALRCVRPGIALVEVVLTPVLASGQSHSISVWLEKSCRGEHREGLSLGTAKGSSNLVKDGIAQEDKPPAVGGLLHTSHFFVRYSPQSADDPDQQLTPEVTCIAENGDTTLGTNVEAEDSADENGDQRLDVSYLCLARGTFRCTLRLVLKFWTNPEVSWQKQCGGEARPDITVESNLGTYPVVFENGKPTSSWALKNPAVQLVAEEDDVTFSVSRVVDSEGGSLAVLHEPKAVSSDPAMLDVSIVDASALVGRVLASRDDAAAVLAHHTCKGHGDVEVTVFIPVEENSSKQPQRSFLAKSSLYGPVSFAYHKHCGLYPGMSILALSIWASLFCCSGSVMACVVAKYRTKQDVSAEQLDV
mmetsp:Transcript_37770/g.70801  ORF Transcript_37770/g.70801 Transcript_37770/m.70801 type:complete len:532 (+) Transcript_37770:109-1704(+)